MKKKLTDEERKARKALRNKAYREANKEKISQYLIKTREKRRDQGKAYREDNKEKILQYRIKNREKRIDQTKQWRKRNKDVVAEYQKQYRKENKDQIAAYMKQWRKKNKDAVAEYSRKHSNEYQKERRKVDPIFALRGQIRTLINQSILRRGYSKKSKTYDIIGCSFEEFFRHLESQFTEGMSWDVWDEIQIDHRLPISAATTEEEALALSHHRNLRPMWAEDNLAKSDRYCPKDLALYFSKHLHHDRITN